MGKVGTLNAANPGNLGQITTGSWMTRPIGPYDGTTAAPGWSADSRAASFQSKWDFVLPQYLTAIPAGAMSCWIRFSSGGTVTGINVFSSLMRLSTSLDGFMVNIGIDPNGDAFFSDTNTNNRFGRAFGFNIWYFCLLEFKNINVNSVGYKFTITPLGGSPQVLRDRTAGYNPGGASQIGIAHFCNLVNSGSGLWDGRAKSCFSSNPSGRSRRGFPIGRKSSRYRWFRR